MSLKYSKRLRVIRDSAKDFSGLLCVPRSVVLTYLTAKEIKRFEKKYKWHKWYTNKKRTKFTRWAYFWDIQSVTDGAGG